MDAYADGSTLPRPMPDDYSPKIWVDDEQDHFGERGWTIVEDETVEGPRGLMGLRPTPEKLRRLKTQLWLVKETLRLRAIQSTN